MEQKDQKQETHDMTKEEAFVILSQVASKFQGNLQDHVTIQGALSLIGKELVITLDKTPEKN